MSVAVFPPWWFVLRCASIEACVQLGGVKSWWENCGLQEGLDQWVLPGTAATMFLSVQWAAAACCLHRRPSVLAGKSGPVSYDVTTFFPWVLMSMRPRVHPQRVEFLSPQSYKFWWSNPTGLQSQILRNSSVARFPDWGALHGPHSFHSCGGASVV